MFVVLIAEASHELAVHLEWDALVRFLAVFGLIWALWLNGALSHEMLGRDDGRSRTTLFLQMLLLIVLAAFAEDAAGDDATGFIIIGALVFLLQAGVWLAGVREAGGGHTRALAATFAVGTTASAALLGASLAVGRTARVGLWSLGLVAGIVALLVVERIRPPSLALTTWTADRMVERFGLITIVVLGEIVFGVVNGFARSEEAGLDTLVIGLLGLWIAFALWWNFFDFVGRASPATGRIGPWIVTHLPIAAGMAAIGAATARLTADDGRSAATWLLAGSVVLVLVAMTARERTLEDRVANRDVQQRFTIASIIGGLAVVAIGVLQPEVWLGMALVVAILIAVWLATFEAWIRHVETLEARS